MVSSVSREVTSGLDTWKLPHGRLTYSRHSVPSDREASPSHVTTYGTPPTVLVLLSPSPVVTTQPFLALFAEE